MLAATSPRPSGGYPREKHSVVVTYPEARLRLLYVNRGFMSHIKGLRRQESDVPLDMVFRHIAETPRLTCRAVWQPNALAFWNHCCIQQHAVWETSAYTPR
ncbi:MAG: hypothetical protein CMQ29_09895 [Gammaproteobacteria bacterium]|nr:hypothetical protein [Gammaproteobacteria bacterium]